MGNLFTVIKTRLFTNQEILRLLAEFFRVNPGQRFLQALLNLDIVTLDCDQYQEESGETLGSALRQYKRMTGKDFISKEEPTERDAIYIPDCGSRLCYFTPKQDGGVNGSCTCYKLCGHNDREYVKHLHRMVLRKQSEECITNTVDNA